MTVQTGKKHLSDADVVKQVTSYVDDASYNYAVLIDGGWRCGKTYFVKKVLMLALSDHEKDKTIQVGSTIGKAVVQGILSFKGISCENPIDLSMLVSFDNAILIFDDLERCLMDVSEVLGYIKNFVEHDGIKTFIISNEKEIASTKLSLNKELKYLVALDKSVRVEIESEKM